MDVLQMALERRDKLQHELTKLENFIEIANNLLAKSAECAKQKTAPHTTERPVPRLERKKPTPGHQEHFGLSLATDSFQFQSLLEDERQKRMARV